MFDVGFWEMAFISAIALVVIGPKQLPGAARTAGLWVAKARRMIMDVKSDIKREMDQYDSLKGVADIKKEVRSATKDFRTATSEVVSGRHGIKAAGEAIKNTVDDVSATVNRMDGAAAAKKHDSTRKEEITSKTPGPAKKKAAKKVTKKKTTKKKATGKKATRKKVTKKKITKKKASTGRRKKKNTA